MKILYTKKEIEFLRLITKEVEKRMNRTTGKAKRTT